MQDIQAVNVRDALKEHMYDTSPAYAIVGEYLVLFYFWLFHQFLKISFCDPDTQFDPMTILAVEKDIKFDGMPGYQKCQTIVTTKNCPVFLEK